MAQQAAIIEALWTTKVLKDGRTVVFGPSRDQFFEKTLWGKPATSNGEIVWVFSSTSAAAIAAKVAYVNKAIEKRNAERAAAPVASSRPSYSRRPRTSSGWCEACEDGAINQCKRGGCY